MFKNKLYILLGAFFLCGNSPVSAGESVAEQELVRLYFGMGATASSETFQCLGEEQKLRLDKQLEQMREQSTQEDLNVQVILRQGLRLTSQYADSLTCVTMSDFANRLELIEAEPDPEYSEYLSFTFGRELLLEMIKNASIEAKMMNNFAYGNADLFSGDTNELLYQLARDQIEFSLVLLNDYDIGIDTKYLYTYLLERSEELGTATQTDDAVFAGVRKPVGAIYRKMGMILLGLDSKEENANYLEVIIDYAEDTRGRLQTINNTILNSLPSAI